MVLNSYGDDTFEWSQLYNSDPNYITVRRDISYNKHHFEVHY